MTLPMSRPFKHPNSGVYWLRKRVPDDLRSVVGKREEKLSLRTRDPEEAKRLHAQALVELESRWANLRRGGRALSKDQIESAAALLFDFYLAHCCAPLPDQHRATLNTIDADSRPAIGDQNVWVQCNQFCRVLAEVFGIASTMTNFETYVSTLQPAQFS
jgi:hypothetical protein